MAKNKKLATTIMLGAAGMACVVWFVLCLRAAYAFTALGTMEGDGSFWGDLFGESLGTIYGGAAIGAWIETVVFAIVGALLLYASYKAWKTKWGKKQGAFTFAIVAVVLVATLGMWSYIAGGLVV